MTFWTKSYAALKRTERLCPVVCVLPYLFSQHICINIVMGTERKYLMATPIKTDAAPWSLLVLPEVTALGISLSLPGRGSAQCTKRSSLGAKSQIPNQQAQKMPEELHSPEQCQPVVLSAAASALPSQG